MQNASPLDERLEVPNDKKQGSNGPESFPGNGIITVIPMPSENTEDISPPPPQSNGDLKPKPKPRPRPVPIPMSIGGAASLLQVPAPRPKATPVPIVNNKVDTVPLSKPKPLTRSSTPDEPPPENLPLGLKEVIHGYRLEYYKKLYAVVKRNSLALVIGTSLALVGLAIMIYCGLLVMDGVETRRKKYGEATASVYVLTTTESALEKLGAILTGIGAFIDMVSVVYILDRRAILERERLEQIDTFKKNRKQPRNIFEILLANAKNQNKANIEAENNFQASGVGVIVTSETSPAAQPINKPVEVKVQAPKPTVVGVRKPPSSSSSNATNRSVTKAKQLRELSKAKGEDVEVFVMSHGQNPKSSRPPSAKWSEHRDVETGQDLPEPPLHVSATLREWLNTSIRHTMAQEFATEIEEDNRSDTVSLSIASDKEDKKNGFSTTPLPTQQNIPDRQSSKAKTSFSSPRVLPGSQVPTRTVFQEMYQAEKSNSQILYEKSMGKSVDPDIELPPLPAQEPVNSLSRRPSVPDKKVHYSTPISSGKSAEHSSRAWVTSGSAKPISRTGSAFPGRRRSNLATPVSNKVPPANIVSVHNTGANSANRSSASAKTPTARASSSKINR